MESKLKTQGIVQGIVFSRFGEKGPEPLYYCPESVDLAKSFNITTKIISIMVGENEYFSEGISILPFTRYKNVGLTYTFSIIQENTAEGRIPLNLTILISEGVQEFIFQNIDHLSSKLKEIAEKLLKTIEDDGEFDINKVGSILKNFNTYLKEFETKYLELQGSVTPDMIETIKGIVLSYFHTKIGPIPFFSFPGKPNITEEQKARISNDLEMTSGKQGFFTRTYQDMGHFSYYFEIPSEWARGKKEMLMVSYVFEKNPSNEIINYLSLRSIKFIEKIQLHPEIYKGFYYKSGLISSKKLLEEEKNKIKEMNELLKQWIKSLYLASMDEIRSIFYPIAD
ncbi:MAG: hypothetical protein GF329_17035 [Candidatus Lokiarchaeota archaeon]|nr:hypothetical protein [Candidatus Lokiarchaeota archaeon]